MTSPHWASRLAPTPENLSRRIAEQEERRRRQTMREGYMLAACGSMLRHAEKLEESASILTAHHVARKAAWELVHDAGRPYPIPWRIDVNVALEDAEKARHEACAFLIMALVGSPWGAL
jgi:hypothetical protein